MMAARGAHTDITFYLFFTALLVSFAAWCIFLWAIRTGQFQDVEDIKYQVWPEPESGREEGASTKPASTAPRVESSGAR
jgi:cbb3-type cytochrome oxidase maturation protein